MLNGRCGGGLHVRVFGAVGSCGGVDDTDKNTYEHEDCGVGEYRNDLAQPCSSSSSKSSSSSSTCYA